jgi:cyanophycinase
MTERFLLLGAGEFLPWSAEAERYALDGAPQGHVAVLATASAREGDVVFEGWGRRALEHYGELGIAAQVVELKTRDDASRADLIAAVEGAAMVFFSGGNPLYLQRVLEGSPVLAAIRRRLAAGAVFAGCSAGAMVAGAHVPRERGPEFRYVGLGLIPDVRFGVHWNRMPGFLPGLKEFIVSGGRRDSFVGIDESTAIAGDGVSWRVFGVGGVDVRRSDGRRARYRAGEEFSLA